MYSLIKPRSCFPADGPLGADCRPLVILLRDLLSAVGPNRSGEPDTERLSARPARWEDEDYIYIESDVPAAGVRDIDISVHHGRVLIRMER